MDNLSGQHIKGYELLERIAAGGFGAVYRAHQSSVGREVAVKVILPGLANQPDFIRRFESEAQLIARLEHHFIVPLYDYWRDPDGAYLVMRYLRGGSLHDHIHGHSALSIEEAFNLVSPIAQALHVAHRNQVIHRDIKPSNILLDEDGTAFLADFGIAKDYTIAQSITEPDSFIGSPQYLAPEQARSEPVTPQTDIYSLGVVLYEMLVGEHPFPNLEKIVYLFKHLNEPLPDITTLDGRICADVNAVIQKATAKDPRQRYVDVIKMMEALRQAAQLDTEPTPTSAVELLTPREQEVMQLIMDGKSNREIAQLLVLTEGTIKTYINRIYHKLNVRSRVQAMVRARELNFVIQKSEATVIGTTGHLPEPENPYKGLRAFQAADAQVFFGREKLTRKLLSRVQETGDCHRFLCVVGPSGSGKSSVVKAGLIPALWRGDLPGSENWYIVELLPGQRPIDELEIALLRIASDNKLNLRDQLERNEHGLLRVANLILPDDGSELLIVIDQFEELFTLVEDEDKRLHFLNLISEAVWDKRSRVRVVVTLRADYYDRPLQYPDFGEMMRDRVETVLPLGAAELERAISEPALHAGVQFEDGLVSRIVSDAHYQPGALPLLQYALTELFERRNGRKLTLEAYEAIGGTGGALAARADEIYLEGNEDSRELVRQLFLQLVTLGEGAEDTRRRVARSQLLDMAPDKDLMDEMIDLYAASRLLSLDNAPSTRHPTIEVAHEAILREWDRLRKWLNESREDIRQERALSRTAEDWREHNRDESFLLRGARLDQVEKWRDTTTLIQTPLEQDFIAESLKQRDKERQVEVERKEREARLELRSRNLLRGLVAVLTLATILSGGFGLFALDRQQAALASAAESQNVALIAGSQAALANNDTDTAVALAWQAVQLNPDSAFAQAQLSEAAYAPGIVHFRENAQVDDVAISPDGQTIVSGVSDGAMIAWNRVTGDILWKQDTNSEFNDLDFSPDGLIVASTMPDKVILWDIRSGEIVKQLDYFPGQESIKSDFSPDGRLLASGGWGVNALFTVSDIETGEDVLQLPFQSRIEGIEFMPDATAILIGTRSGLMTLIDAQSGETIHEMQPDPDANAGSLGFIAISPDGNTAAAAYTNAGVFLWDLKTGELLQKYITNGGAFSVKFHPTNNSLIYGTDTEFTVIDLQSSREVLTLTGHTDAIVKMSISDDGRYAVSADPVGNLIVWELIGGHVIHQLAEPSVLLFETDISPDGNTALVASTDGTVSLFDVDTGQMTLQLVDVQPIVSATFSPDGQTILTGGGYRLGEKTDPGRVILWDAKTGEEIRRFIGHPYAIYAVEFSPDGRSAASSGSGALAFLWDVATGDIIYRFDDRWVDSLWPVEAYWDVEFSPDGSVLLGAHSSGPILIWDVATGETIGQLDGHSTGSPGMAFSADGQRLVSGGWDGLAILWDMQTQDPIRQFTNHASAVGQVRFSPDERFMLGGSGDRTNSLWNVETGEVLRRYGGGFGVSPNFTPDGTKAVVGYWDGHAEIWRIDDALTNLLEWTQANRYIPELTCERRKLYRVEPLCKS